MKEPLLYLCHRIPFPPNKGDKITTFNILKFLSQHYAIHLGCFVDDTFDLKYREDVEQYCESCHFITLSRPYSQLKGLTALLGNDPITLPFYYRRQMQQWVDHTLAQIPIYKTLIYSGCMAQYVMPYVDRLHTVMHFADIDSDKWRQYAQKSSGIMKSIYAREHKTLAAYEKTVADAFNISCFVTESETAAFRAMLPAPLHPKIQPLENGLDSQFFSPDVPATLCESYDLANENYIVFTGAMDYWANQDAVIWFCNHVWDKIRKACPEAKLYLVGSSPSPSVMNLSQRDGVTVTGRVDDVRPYLQYAKAAIAPMQIARGVQNKMLEAMSMAKPVIVSSLTIEGLEGYPTQDLEVCDDPSPIANWLIDKLNQQAIVAEQSRQWIKQHYSWEAKLTPLLDYLRIPSMTVARDCR